MVYDLRKRQIKGENAKCNFPPLDLTGKLGEWQGLGRVGWGGVGEWWVVAGGRQGSGGGQEWAAEMGLRGLPVALGGARKKEGPMRR